MEKTVTEWQIMFTMTSGLEDFYTEDEAEYNEKFQDLIDNGDLQYVEQCIRKDYVWNEELEDWDEDCVEILYDAENYDDYKDTQRASSLTESKDPTYIVCSYYDEKLHGLEDELKTDDWSEVEDFAHRKLMQGNMLEIENTKTGKYRRINPDEYDETFDGEFIVRPEELAERFDKDLDGLKGTLTDLKNTLKTESKDTNRQLQQNYKKSLERELDKVQKEIENAGPGDISGLEDRRDFLMNKIDQLESDLSRKDESKTNWKSQVKDIFKDMYEVGKPVDPDDVDRFVTELIDEEHIGSEDIRNEMIDYCLELLDNFNDLDMVEESKDVTLDDVKDTFNNLSDNIKSYLEDTDNVPTKEIEGTLWFDITQEEKEQLEQFVNYIDTISEDIWRKWDEKTKLDMSSYANNADRICRNCTLKLESKDIKTENKNNKVEVENYHLEDMGGHTMAVFGKLKDGRYFAGNEEVMTIYDEDIWPQYCEDDPDTTIWEQEHTLLSTSRYDTNKENLQIYYDIISQTSFFDEDDLVWFKEHLGLDNNDVADKKQESKLTEETNTELQEEVEINIDDAIYTYLTTKGYETEESAKEFIKDYVVVKTWYEDMTSASSSEIMEKYLVVEVRAELDYDSMAALSSDLDKVVQKYDASSYFDFITGGIIRAYIQVDDKKLTESIDTNKVVTDFQNMVKEQGIHVTRDVLNEYMTDLFENEMETEEDMDNLNEAESWLENYYGLNEIEEYDDETNWSAEEESDALDRFEQRYMSGGNGWSGSRKTESLSNKVFNRIKSHTLFDYTQIIMNELGCSGSLEDKLSGNIKYACDDVNTELAKIDNIMTKELEYKKVADNKYELQKDNINIDTNGKYNFKEFNFIVSAEFEADGNNVIGKVSLDNFRLDESKKIESYMSKEDIMQCYISDINEVAYTYKKKEAQQEIDNILNDLKGDKDLDEDDKAFIIKMIRPTLLNRNIKLTETLDMEKYLKQHKNKKTENKDNDFKNAVMELHGYIEANPKTISQDLRKAINNKSLDDYLKTKAAMTDDEIKSFKDKYKLIEDYVRTDLDDIGGWNPQKFKVPLNSARETLQELDDLMEITFNNLYYAPGLSEEFLDELQQFEDGPLDKEYDRIKKAVSDTETREINNSKKPIKKSTKKKTEAVDKSSEDRLQEIANEIKEIPIIKKHTLDHTWLSGSSTKVYPVSTYLDTNGTGHIDIQLDTKRDYFDKAIQQIKDKYPEIIDGWFNKTDDSCPANLEFKYDSKSDKKVKTEAVDIEDVNIEKEKEKVNDDLQRAGAKDMIDTENELVDGIKKEIYQYTKQQGLDLEKLRKQGVELETISDTIDKVVGDMVSKSAIEFMDQTGQEINWDFEIKDNDIHIVWGNQ